MRRSECTPFKLASMLIFVCTFISNGTAAEGRVQVVFTAEHATATLHEPIYIDFSIRNGLKQKVLVDLGLNKKSAFRFSIVQTGNAMIHVPLLQSGGFGSSGKVSIGPMETYNQKLLLNEWYQFSDIGNYTVVVQIDAAFKTESGELVKPETSNSFPQNISARDEHRLSVVCDSLIAEALAQSALETRLTAAATLSFIEDPIAIAYMNQLLSDGKIMQPYGIEGLGRLGSDEAVNVLITHLSTPDNEIKSAIVFALRRIEQRTSSPTLRDRIRAALKN